MKILIAPDSFKGSLTALQAANAIETGIKRALPRAVCTKAPMADGGDGTVQALVDAVGGNFHTKKVTGPAGQPVRARYGMLADGETAVIEVASSSGLLLIDDKNRNPLNSTSFGTGELIVAAIKKGAKKLIVGLGGSATVDAGMGMAQAIGVRFLGEKGREIQQPGCGRLLRRVSGIDLSGVNAAIGKTAVTLACDVDNPLFGEQGAAYIYGPQKGATPAMVKGLDDNLRHFNSIMERELGVDLSAKKGAGAAGGLGFGLTLFANAKIKNGVRLVAEMTALKEQIAAADLVITGEGRIDVQTAFGKVPVGVAGIAKKLKVPVIAIGGGLGDDSRSLFKSGIDGLEAAIARDMPLKSALLNSEDYLADAAERVMRLISIGRRLGNR